MNYFESTLRLRNTDPANPYLVHQRLDFLLQERLGNKLPYGWRRRAHPSVPTDSLIYLRTATPLNLPGEQRHELALKPGDVVMANVDLCVPVTVSSGDSNKKRHVPLTDENLPHVLARHCEKNGLHLQSHAASPQYREHYGKKGQRFFLCCNPLSLIAEVQDVALTEQAIVYGIGLKRVFGYGLLSDLEVL
ncbi:hypothetical protein ACK300_12535 [Aeromonas caviae]